MTDCSKEIFEKYQVRKTSRQKSDFRSYLMKHCESEGYGARVERGSFGVNNVIVGDPDSAKVIFVAHYDTCPRLPFPNFITPKSTVLYLISQLLLVSVFMFLPTIIISVLASAVTLYISGNEELALIVRSFSSSAVLWASVILMLCGPANKHTANDNTSGVITLVELMHALPEQLRQHAAFVFFDLEESGLLGSSDFAKKHRKIAKETLVINFDCVSDGEYALFALRSGAGEYAELLESSYFPTDGITVDVAKRGTVYPSDQLAFKCGVGVAFLKKSKHGIVYMDRIHTNRDVIFREENVSFLTDGSVRLVDAISKK